MADTPEPPLPVELPPEPDKVIVDEKRGVHTEIHDDAEVA